MVISVRADLRTPCLAACRMRMRHAQWLARKRIADTRHIITAQQVAADLLHHTALDVIVERRVLFRRTAENRPFATRQVTFRAYRTGREVAVVESALAAEVVVVIIILQPHGLTRRGVLSRTLALFSQAAQVVIHIVSPFVRCTLHTVLRIDDTV